jgi:hypothetical protein
MRKKKDWFKLKQYPHIGLPLTHGDRLRISAYVKNKETIEKHAFFPFIHRKLKVRRFRREVCHDGTRSKLRYPTSKERELHFSNHLDSNIFSYYASLISKKYEEKISNDGFSECVSAYRTIPLESDNDKSRNKCSIDFAKEVFDFIKISQVDKTVVAITFDIKSFFDSLDHIKLKKAWSNVMHFDKLPGDHYNVYRNITKFSYIEEDNLFEELSDKILVERNEEIVEKSVKKVKYMRKQRAVGYCEKSMIHLLRAKNLIKANKYTYDSQLGKVGVLRKIGIPQGSPISSVLANVYMYDFDKSVNQYVSSINGIYRRYSDDMVIVCDKEYEKNVSTLFHALIKDCHLKINQSKTQVFYFRFNSATLKQTCFEKNLNTEKNQTNTKFEYLGFQFNGQQALLKNSSLSNYYRKMKRSISRGKFFSEFNKTNTKGELFKSRLYKRFTHLGAERRRIYIRDENNKSKFKLSYKYEWGNYLSYARMASQIMDRTDGKIGLTGGGINVTIGIRKQVRRHWAIFHSLINVHEEK